VPTELDLISEDTTSMYTSLVVLLSVDESIVVTCMAEHVVFAPLIVVTIEATQLLATSSSAGRGWKRNTAHHIQMRQWLFASYRLRIYASHGTYPGPPLADALSDGKYRSSINHAMVIG